MKKSVFSLSVVICFLFTSCTGFMYVSKTREPEISLEKKAGSIVFINFFDYTNLQNVKEKNEVAYHEAVQKIVEGLVSSSSSGKPYNFFLGDSLRKGLPDRMLTQMAAADSVIKTCNRFRSDMMLALDSLNIFFDWETNTDINGDGSKSKTKDFYLYTRFYLSLYSSTGQLINRSRVDNSLFYKSRPALSGLITFQPSIAKASQSVGSLALKAGSDYAARFYSSDVRELRTIYTGKVFKESNLSMQDGNWNRAIQLLEPLIKSPDPKIREKAAQNMSVAREGAGLK